MRTYVTSLPPPQPYTRETKDGKSCACKQAIKEQCDPGKGTPHCAKTSVNCIEGTGDFRLALMETRRNSNIDNTNNVDAGKGKGGVPTDNFCPTTGGDNLHACIDQIGADYRAYQFRFMPHVGTTYVHPKDSEAGGFFRKQNSTDPFDDHRSVARVALTALPVMRVV